VDNENARVELDTKLSELIRREHALRGGHGGLGMLPELVEQEEQRLRLELERMKLESERRNFVALKQVAERTLDESDALLKELKERPLFRAMQANTDVAFVPYGQLEGVAPGRAVYACFKGLVRCREVGRVAQVLEGEVAMEDPWGERARGRYAILALDDPDAHQERTLRVRAE
jgi:hypothetical protein